MSLSEAQVTGEGENVAEACVKAKAALARLHMNGDEMAANLRALIAAAVKANAEQEEAKRIAKAKTEAVEEAYHRARVTTSGYLDIVIAAVDKDSDDAKNFRRIRSRITRPEPDEPVAPLPVPDPGRAQ